MGKQGLQAFLHCPTRSMQNCTQKQSNLQRKSLENVKLKTSIHFSAYFFAPSRLLFEALQCIEEVLDKTVQNQWRKIPLVEQIRLLDSSQLLKILYSANMKKNKEEETELPFMNGHGEVKNSKVYSLSANAIFLLECVVMDASDQKNVWGGSFWQDF